MKISVIATVKNEGESLRPLLESLLRQTVLPYEIVFADGGSTDNTIAILESYQAQLPLKIISAVGSNISAGRNIAIRAATGSIIAAVDGGVILDRSWVETITHPICEGQSEVVSGWFQSDPHTTFELVLGATVLPSLEDVNPITFLPSSRSIAFTKTAWESVGGYPEWLDYCEDLLFDFALRQQYGGFAFAPRAIAYFRPRTSLAAFAKQYYLYARGDGKADLWRKRHLIRYLTYGVIAPFLLKGVADGKRIQPFLLMVGLFVYCRRPFQRLWKQTPTWGWPQRIFASLQIPLIRVVGDVAKMIGYPVGVIWRLFR